TARPKMSLPPPAENGTTMWTWPLGDQDSDPDWSPDSPELVVVEQLAVKTSASAAPAAPASRSVLIFWVDIVCTFLSCVLSSRLSLGGPSGAGPSWWRVGRR